MQMTLIFIFCFVFAKTLYYRAAFPLVIFMLTEEIIFTCFFFAKSFELYISISSACVLSAFVEVNVTLKHNLDVVVFDSSMIFIVAFVIDFQFHKYNYILYIVFYTFAFSK